MKRGRTEATALNLTDSMSFLSQNVLISFGMTCSSGMILGTVETLLY